MLITSPEYIVGQYADWYHSLSIKNELNIHSWDQNISFLGIVRRWTGCTTYSDLWLIAPDSSGQSEGQQPHITDRKRPWHGHVNCHVDSGHT